MEGSLVVVMMGVICLGVIGFVQSSCNLVCSPGEYLSSSCNCLPCPNDTFNDKSNNDSKCRPCKKRCQPSRIIKKACTRTQDTVCSCKTGKYLDPGILYCMDCRVCPAGSGASQPCTTESNTICSTCVMGKTYSNRASFSKPCTPCSVCAVGYFVIRNCTTTTDTVCQIVAVVNTTQKSITRTRTSNAPISATGGSSASQASKKRDFLIPVLVVVVFILVCLVIFVGLKLYKRAKARREPPVGGQDSEEAIPFKAKTIPVSTSRHSGLRGRHTRHPRRAENNRESSDSQGSTGSLQEEKPRNSERLLRGLPNESVIIEQLAFLLNPKGRNNWIRLAGELGYSKTEVDYFNIEPTSATQNLLTDWRTSKSSTLGVLYGCLRKMRRDDACAVLEDV